MHRVRSFVAAACSLVGVMLLLPTTAVTAFAGGSCPYSIYWRPPGEPAEYEYIHQFDCGEQTPAAGCYRSLDMMFTYWEWAQFDCLYESYAGECSWEGCRMTEEE